MTASPNAPSEILPQGRKSLADLDVRAGETNGEERVRHFYEKGKEKALHAEENFENYVRTHPVKSVLIATGVGVTLGFLLGRKR